MSNDAVCHTTPLPRIGGDQIVAATKQFPPPELATVEFMEGNAVTVDGFNVIVTFRRQVIRHPRKTYYLWSMESARYVDAQSHPSSILLR